MERGRLIADETNVPGGGGGITRHGSGKTKTAGGIVIQKAPAAKKESVEYVMRGNEIVRKDGKPLDHDDGDEGHP